MVNKNLYMDSWCLDGKLENYEIRFDGDSPYNLDARAQLGCRMVTIGFCSYFVLGEWEYLYTGLSTLTWIMNIHNTFCSRHLPIVVDGWTDLYEYNFATMDRFSWGGQITIDFIMKKLESLKGYEFRIVEEVLCIRRIPPRKVMRGEDMAFKFQ